LSLDLSYLLPDFALGCNVHAQDNVADFGLRERTNVDVILLAIVQEYQIFKSYFGLEMNWMFTTSAA